MRAHILPIAFWGICSVFAVDQDFTLQQLDSVQHLPHHLRSQALTFASEWNAIYSHLQDNKIGKYVQDVIQIDGPQHVRRPSYEIIPFEENISTQGIQTFCHHTKTSFKHLCDTENAFAQYFQGFVLCKNDEDQEIKASGANLLKAASDQYYVRATQFILENPDLMDILQVTKQDLREKELAVTNPCKLISDFILHHPYNGGIEWADIHRLANALNFLPGDYKSYGSIYGRLAKQLSKSLQAHKEKNVDTRLLAPAFMGTVVGAVSAILQGTSSVTNNADYLMLNYTCGNMTQILSIPPSSPSLLNKTIGSVSIASGGVGLAVTLIGYPITSNFIYSFNMEGFSLYHWPIRKGRLLPSSFADDEISKQSHVVALWGGLL
jgi:hypothetical protein